MNSQCKLKWRSTPVLGKLSRHRRHLIASGTNKSNYYFENPISLNFRKSSPLKSKSG